MSQRMKPFVISILSNKDSLPLQSAATYSGQTMIDAISFAKAGGTKEYSPPLSNSEISHSAIIVP